MRLSAITIYKVKAINFVLFNVTSQSGILPHYMEKWVDDLSLNKSTSNLEMRHLDNVQ